jgi:hypothetical protein
MATLAEVLRQAGYVTPEGQVVGPRTTTAQTMGNYIRNIIPNAAQNLAQQRADIDAALTMGDQGIQIADKEAFARQMPNVMGMTSVIGIPANRLKQTLSGFDESDVIDYANAINRSKGAESAKNEAAAAVLSGTNNKFIVYDGPKIAGAAAYNIDDASKTVFIDHVGSLIKGTGRQMVQEIEKNAPKGYKVVLTSSDEAKGFWDKLGYKPTGEGSLLAKDMPKKQLIPEVYQEANKLEKTTGIKTSSDDIQKIQKIRAMMEKERLNRRDLIERQLNEVKK